MFLHSGGWNDGWANGNHCKEWDFCITCPMISFCEKNKEHMRDCYQENCPIKKGKGKTMKITDIKNGEYFQFVDKDGNVQRPVYKKVRGINQNSIQISFPYGESEGFRNVSSGSRVVKADPEKAKETKKPEKIPFSEVEVGDEFYTYDSNLVFIRVSRFKNLGSNFDAVTKNGKIPTLFYNDTMVTIVKKAEDKTEKPLTLADLKVGDKFRYVNTYFWEDKWKGILTKTGSRNVKFANGEEIDDAITHHEVILVTEADEKIKEPKKITFGELKVGDKFIVSNGIEKFEAEKINPYMDKSCGFWVNCKMSKSWYGVCPIIDQQEVELVEKKLTAGDMEPGEKFKVLGNDEIYKAVYDGKAPANMMVAIDQQNCVCEISKKRLIERVV